MLRRESVKGLRKGKKASDGERGELEVYRRILALQVAPTLSTSVDDRLV